MVDDPFVFGQIAAANSLSDVFAMGGDVKTALNVVGFDGAHHDKEILGEILRGGQSKIVECGGVLLGGHTIQTPEMYYGLSVTGYVHPKRIYQNNTPKEGDVLILTKPLGLGVMTTALKADLLTQEACESVAEVLATLNYKASQIMRKYSVSACTDITGFGFLGHAKEMAAQNVTLEVYNKNIPLLQEALEQAAMGIVPGGSHRNKSFLEPFVEFEVALNFEQSMLLFDAQTSGGLLFAIEETQAHTCLQELHNEGINAASIVGVVKAKAQKPIRVCE